MRKFISIALATLTLSSLSAVQYFGVDVGVNHAEVTNTSHNPKVGMIGGAKYGYVFSTGIRGEVEFAYRYNNFRTQHNSDEKDVVFSKESNSVHSRSYMVNALYDVNEMKVYDFTPYIGIGIGYCQNTDVKKIKYDSKSVEDKIKDNRFAYQAIVGAKYAISDNLCSAFEYNYFSGKSHAKVHSMRMSLIRNF